MANHLPSENQIRLSKICAEHDIAKLLELMKSKKNLKDIRIHSCFYTACTNESNRKNEFIDLFLNNEILKKGVDVEHICLNMIIINNFELFKKLSVLIPIDNLFLDYLNQVVRDGNIEF